MKYRLRQRARSPAGRIASGGLAGDDAAAAFDDCLAKRNGRNRVPVGISISHLDGLNV